MAVVVGMADALYRLIASHTANICAAGALASKNSHVLRAATIEAARLSLREYLSFATYSASEYCALGTC